MARGVAQVLVKGAGFEAGHIANQRPGQQFDHGRQGRALVAAKRQHGAFVHHGRGVGARRAGGVNAPAFRQGAATAPVQLDLTAGNGAGGKVKHIRVLAGARPAKRQGVGTKHGALAACRGYPRVAGRHGHTGQTLRREHFHFRPQRREVVTVVDDQGGHAHLARFFDQMLAADFKRQLRKAKPRVYRHDRRRALGNHRHGVAHHLAAAQRGGAYQQTVDAVRMAFVPLAGRDRGGNGLCMRCRQAVVREHAHSQAVHFVKRERNGARHGDKFLQF